MVKYFLFAVLLLGSVMSYGLDPNTERCEFHFPYDTSDKNEYLADLLSNRGYGEAVKMCTANNGEKGYYIAYAVKRKKGVSYFYLREVFKTVVADRCRWVFTPPEDETRTEARVMYMQVGSGNFRQDHEGFVQVEGLSIGVFKKFSEAWDDILSSKKSFDRATSSISILYKLLPDTASQIKKLKRALYSTEDIPNISSIRYIKGNNTSFPNYSFYAGNKSHYWHIDFDFDGDDIRFESVTLISE